MGERGLMDSVNDVVKAAFELYAADGKKLNDGDSFTVKLNNGALTISVKDKTLNVELEPDRDAAGDTPYELARTVYERTDGVVINAAELMKQVREGGNDDREKAD